MVSVMAYLGRGYERGWRMNVHQTSHMKRTKVALQRLFIVFAHGAGLFHRTGNGGRNILQGVETQKGQKMWL